MSKQKLDIKQAGVVSIMVAMILMMIMSLVALSFAFLVRRESKQSLDRQLSTAAFYAAESGVNDAIAKLKQDSATKITDCDDTTTVLDPSGNGYDAELDGTNITYSCVLIDPAPEDVEIKNLSTNKSRVYALHAVNADGTPATISDIQISWQASPVGGVTGNQFPGNGSHLLPKAGTGDQQNLTTTDGTGMIRASIIPIRNPINKDTLLMGTQNLYLYPTRNGSIGQYGLKTYPGVVPPTNADQGSFADGNCNAGNNKTATPQRPLYCNVVIQGIGGADTVYVRIRSVYKDSDVSIKLNTLAGSGTRVAGAQAVIDSTGRASDVIRRIRVRVPLTSDEHMPEAALESMDSICKRATVYSQGGALTTSPDLPAGFTDPTGACSLN